MGRVLFATGLLAGMLFGSNGAASTNVKPLVVPENRAVQSAAGASIPSESVEIAAVDYCYAGSLIDPTTGESVDFFVLCEEDGPEQNIDLA
jgi:hypothetical protein